MSVSTADYEWIAVRVVLDTSIESNWISNSFLTVTLGLKYLKFTEEKEFSHCNGNIFTAIGCSVVMLHSNNFKGKWRAESFYVAKQANFKILLGSMTIKREELLITPFSSEREAEYSAGRIDPMKGRIISKAFYYTCVNSIL